MKTGACACMTSGGLPMTSQTMQTCMLRRELKKSRAERCCKPPKARDQRSRFPSSYLDSRSAVRHYQRVHDEWTQLQLVLFVKRRLTIGATAARLVRTKARSDEVVGRREASSHLHARRHVSPLPISSRQQRPARYAPARCAAARAASGSPRRAPAPRPPRPLRRPSLAQSRTASPRARRWGAQRRASRRSGRRPGTRSRPPLRAWESRGGGAGSGSSTICSGRASRL